MSQAEARSTFSLLPEALLWSPCGSGDTELHDSGVRLQQVRWEVVPLVADAGMGQSRERRPRWLSRSAGTCQADGTGASWLEEIACDVLWPLFVFRVFLLSECEQDTSSLEDRWKAVWRSCRNSDPAVSSVRRSLSSVPRFPFGEPLLQIPAWSLFQGVHESSPIPAAEEAD